MYSIRPCFALNKNSFRTLHIAKAQESYKCNNLFENISKTAAKPMEVFELLKSIDKSLKSIDHKLSKFEVKSNGEVIKMVPTESLKKD